MLEQRLAEQKSLAKLGEMAAVVAHEVKNPIAGHSRRAAGHHLADASRTARSRDSARHHHAARRAQPHRAGHADVRATAGAAPGADRHSARCCATPRRSSSAIRRMLEPRDQRHRSGRHRRRSRDAADCVSEHPDERRAGDGGPGTYRRHDRRRRRTLPDRHRRSRAGMPEEVREKAFDAFFTTKHRGTGLGLPIAKRVVEAHGGTIQIDVPPEGGTTISVELPLPR